MLSDTTNAWGDHILDVYSNFPVKTDVSSLLFDQKCSLFAFKFWVRTRKQCFLQTHGTSLRKPLRVWIPSMSAYPSHCSTYLANLYFMLIIHNVTLFHPYSTIKRQTCTTITYTKLLYTIISRLPEACS